ncbi:uncharacterized protein NARSGI1_00830 [endosymbiont of Sipalinus gigas]|uniref:SufE family protein n=1 Tax=endosymbiont of Sipalinus gigas TaxID=1972134 RepID=UPI000DC6ECDC|nr:SufE family protein [endosymbiont of Sipalinus gigas]BBA85235.1 uncharacterized protein NARSGI1_00830 [endosymbiont of Sipalinus gigas]
MLIYSLKKEFNKVLFLNKLKLINEWEDKFNLILNNEKFLYKMSKYMIINNNMLKTCSNNIWINLKVKNNIIFMYGYSNSIIVRGLLSIIFIFFNKKKNIININNFNVFIKKINFFKNYNIIYNIFDFIILKLSKI